MHVVIIDTSNYDSKLPTPWQHACNKPKYVHALGCRRSLSTVHRTSSKSLPHITSVATHHICCHTSHLLPHITSVATHHICCHTSHLLPHITLCLLQHAYVNISYPRLVEQTRAWFWCNHTDIWSYAASGTVHALSFWQTHALSLWKYIKAEPLKKGL